MKLSSSSYKESRQEKLYWTWDRQPKDILHFTLFQMRTCSVTSILLHKQISETSIHDLRFGSSDPKQCHCCNVSQTLITIKQSKNYNKLNGWVILAMYWFHLPTEHNSSLQEQTNRNYPKVILRSIAMGKGKQSCAFEYKAWSKIIGHVQFFHHVFISLRTKQMFSCGL